MKRPESASGRPGSGEPAPTTAPAARRDEDAALGMGRSITRRDFLNGVPVGIAGLAALPALPPGLLGAEGSAAPYPPALTGLRGSHAGSFEVAHRLARVIREGGAWDDSGAADGGEFDLVVVGGGISGLAAAYLYRKAAGPDARILVLDNHDDFGGHAKRNEFTYEGRTILGYGGTQSLDSPATFSAAARSLLADLGVDLDLFYTAFDRNYYSSRGLGSAVFFGEEDFGQDRLVSGFGRRPPADLAAEAPLSPAGRADFVRLLEDPGDPWPHLSAAAKKDRLATVSYRDFLNELGMGPEAQALYRQRPHSLFGMGGDGVSALDLWSLGYPGFDGMNLPPGDHPRLSLTAKPAAEPEPYIFHFPDGNATVARLLVRRLIPEAAPGRTGEDMVLARLDYGALDRPGAPCRIRLSSTAVRVRPGGPRAPASVTYVRGGSETRVRAGAVVLAGYNRVVPFLLPELPAEQRRALRYPPKVPLVYTNVLLRDWRSFAAAGAARIHFPAGFHSSLSLDFPVSLGGYRFSGGPEEPIVVHAVRTPCSPGGSAREQHRAGQAELLRTPFSVFERETRRQLARALGPYGFDPARDLAGLTVNRWPHGYTFEYNSLWDPPFPPGAAPHEVARRPFGRVRLAGADCGAYAYTQSAIDQAHRAVAEIVG